MVSNYFYNRVFLLEACIDEASTYGVLSREDILANWLEHTTAQFVIDDPPRADSMLEV